MALVGRQKFNAIVVAIFDLSRLLIKGIGESKFTIALTTTGTSDSSPTRTTTLTLGGARVFHLSVAFSHAEEFDGPNIVVLLDNRAPNSRWTVLTDRLRRVIGTS